MPRLGKNDIALTAKFDCDRFLRFRVASDEERDTVALREVRVDENGVEVGVEVRLDEYVERAKARPGIQLVTQAGQRYEMDRFEDLLAVAGAHRVAHERKGHVNPVLGRPIFLPVDLLEVLQQDEPPLAVVEGQFEVPATLTEALYEAYRQYGLDRANARPDVVWIRSTEDVGPEASDLLGPAEAPEYVLYVIDVKMAADPSLRHFVEVAYYGLALAEALTANPELAQRYAVHRQAYVWPGTHDPNLFRQRHRDAIARGEANPVASALEATLVPIPHEVYHAHVLDFFEGRLLPVLGQPVMETSWHVTSKCQLCDHLLFCRTQAQQDDHLSRLHGLTAGQADLLRQEDIATTAALADAIAADAPAWQRARNQSPQLRAEGASLHARAEALRDNRVAAVPQRRTTAMPRYSRMNILLTVHFDPGSGITFAMGARRVYFRPGAPTGSRPVIDEHAYVVDRVDRMNPSTERARLRELLARINGWVREADAANQQAQSWRDAVQVHFFFWDRLEVTQLRRMIQRHLDYEDPALLQELMALARLFPPEDELPDPEAYRSQPGTVVKGVVERLLGLPEAHTLTLLSTANALNTLDPNPFEHRLRYGFETEMSDQLPFERAYELWEDRVLLKHWHEDPDQRRRYERHEIVEGLRVAVIVRLRALSDVVRQLRRHHGDCLLLRKEPFRLATSSPLQNVPAAAQRLMALQLLDETSQELENRHQLALPIDEREARFISIRGLRPIAGEEIDDAIAAVRQAKPRHATSELRAFVFSPTSRDARIRVGDFTLALHNEEDNRELHQRWFVHLGLRPPDAARLLGDYGINTENEGWRMWLTLGRLLQVELVHLAAMRPDPFLVLALSEPAHFRLAEDRGLIDFEHPLVLDPIYRDFSTGQVRSVLQAVGGRAAR